MATPFVDLLELAVENANDGIAVMAFTGNADVPVRIVYANAAIERLSGLTRRELLEPSNPFLRVQPQNRARYDALFARVRAGEPVLFEIELNGRDRSAWCEIRWTPLQLATGTVTHYVAVIRDLTERQQMERDEELLQGVSRASYGLCILQVPDGDPARRRLVYVNDALCALLRLSREELMTNGLAQHVFSESAAVFDEDLARIDRLGSLERDLFLMRGDGVRRWFHVTASATSDGRGAVERIAMTYRDIDDVKRAQTGTLVLERIVGDAIAPLFLTDEDGRITYANAAAAELFQRPAGDVVGSALGEVLSDGAIAEFNPTALRDETGATLAVLYLRP